MLRMSAAQHCGRWMVLIQNVTWSRMNDSTSWSSHRMKSVFAKPHRAKLRTLAEDSIISGFDVSVFDETVTGDGDFQYGELGSIKELPVLERFEVFIPAE